MINPFQGIYDSKSACRKLSLLPAFIAMFGRIHAQVPVHEEPRHHPVFENDEIRILDVHIPPGDTTLYHIHQTPSFFITFTNTDTGSQLLGKEAMTGPTSAGAVLFENLAPPHIRTHRVWNADTEAFHVMDVELLAQNPRFVEKPLTLPGLELEVDTASVRAYRLTLEKGKAFALPKMEHAYLLVALCASTAETELSGNKQTRAVLPGSFFNVGRQKAFRIRNTGDKPVQYVLLELPVP